MPPQTALTSMPPIAARPASGFSESCIALTEPFEVCVVSAAQSAEASLPKRVSLPSMFGASAARPAAAAFGACSAQTLRPVRLADIASIVPKAITASRRRPVSPPIMNTAAIGNTTIDTVWMRFDSGVGFSSGTAEFGPYQPPPLVPSCFTATIGATGPTGITCSVMPALVSRGVALAAPPKVLGTPCQVSSSDTTKATGRKARTLRRTTSA